MNKKKFTILSPRLGPVQTELYRQVFAGAGYRVKIVEDTQEGVAVGVRYVNQDACYPVILIVGMLVHELLTGNYPKDRVAVFISQTEGICRGANYPAFLRRALQKIGYGEIPIIPLGFFNYEKSPVVKINTRMLLKLAKATVLSDVLTKLWFHGRAYECHKGDSDRALSLCLEKAYPQMKSALPFGFREFIDQAAAEFDRIEKENIRKPVVGIVGEVYLKYNTFGNFQLAERLLALGAEVVVPDMYTFVQFMLLHTTIYHERFGNYPLIFRYHRIQIGVLQFYADIGNRVLDRYGGLRIGGSIHQMRKAVQPVLSDANIQGEGWYLPGKILEYCGQGITDIVCVQPFGCLPGHIVGRGTIKRIRELCGDITILPLDFDPDLSILALDSRLRLLISHASSSSQAKERKS